MQNEYLKLVIGLVLGFFVILYFFPPHTPCTSQRKAYDEFTEGLVKPFNKSFTQCQERANVGRCLASFELWDRIDFKLGELGRQCEKELTNDGVTKNFIRSSMALMTKAAWGDRPPKNRKYKMGFLQPAQLEQFCKMRKHLQLIYGEDEWLGFVEKIVKELPGNETLGRDDTWNNSILSEPCRFN